LRQSGTEVTAIWLRLKERGYPGGVSSVYRFVAQLEKDKIQNGATVRVERTPGEEAQVDFGYAGLMIDPATGEMRKTWAFVITLAFSRHPYVEIVFEQNLANWILLHRHAFESLGGVPKRVVTDNFKAAVTKTDWLGDDRYCQLNSKWTKFKYESGEPLQNYRDFEGLIVQNRSKYAH
jgi:transposase